MRSINTTIFGNICADPKLNSVGKNNVCNFSVAVNTCEKDSEGNYLTNYYEIEWFGAPTLVDRFMKDAKKGTKVFVSGPSWMYSYFSKRNNGTSFGLKLRASDVTIIAPAAYNGQTKGRAQTDDDDYANL